MLQRSLGRCAPPRQRNSSPSKGDTSPLLLKNIVSEAAFGLLNRGLAIMTKPDKASSRPISTGEPTQTLALFHFGRPSVVVIGGIDPMDQLSVTLSRWPLGLSGSLRAKAHLTRIGCAATLVQLNFQVRLGSWLLGGEGLRGVGSFGCGRHRSCERFLSAVS